MKETQDKNSSGQPPATDSAVDGIANRLRELYSEIESEGVPDNLVHLLDRLDQAEKAHSQKDEKRKS